MPEPPAEPPFVKHILSSVGTVTIYGGYWHEMQLIDDPNIPPKEPHAEDQIRLGEIAIDVTDFLHADPKKKLPEARNFADAMVSAFRNAGYRCSRSKVETEENNRLICYITAHYPVKMTRQDLFEQMIEIVEETIKKPKDPPRRSR